MYHYTLTAGSTDVTLYVFVPDASSSVGAGLTGLVYNSSGLVAYYTRSLAAATALTLATQTVTGAHSDGGFVEVSSANAPGLYRLDLSDAVCAAGVAQVHLVLKGATNMVPVVICVDLALQVVTLANGAHGGAAASLNLGAGATISNASGSALTLTSSGSNGHGLLAQGHGTGSGITGSGGGVEGNGIYAVGDANGQGILAVGGDSALGLTAGLYLKSNSSGIPVGLYIEDGATITDDAGTALLISSTGGNGDGVTITGNGSGGDLVADITGNLSGSVGSVTGDTKQTADVATLITTVGVAGAGLTALATQASVNTIDDFLDTEIAAILADTNELQTDWANGGRLDLILDIIAADTTTDIPALIADVPTAVENADALLARNVSGGSSAGRTVKQALHAIRNKVVVSGGTMTVYDTDDASSSWTAAVTGTPGADPITTVDPA